MNNFLRFGAAATLAASAATALAGEFTVTPVRIFMTPRDRAIAVTVSNDGSEEVVMQAELYSWRQKADGSDDLAVTEDLILSPPILKVPARSRQVVRLARLGAAPTVDELTYRLIVREVPEAKSQQNPQQLGLQLALAFSLPVFVTPPGAKRVLQCDLSRAAADVVKATCTNSGRAYAQIRAFEVVSSAGVKLAGRETGGYVLASVKRDFEIKGTNGKIPGGKVKLQAALDDGSTQTFEASLPD